MIKKILPVFIIFLLWLIFSKPFFLDNKIPYPTSYQLNNLSLWNNYDQYLGPIKNPAMPDVVNQIMPWKYLTIESWKNLTVPLWNPYSFSGNPHLANYQSSSFSVTNIFFFFFNFNNAWGLSVLIQTLLAGIFMYLFIRSLRLSQTASLLSAVSFMFCGFITTWASWTTLSLAISFLPLALFAIEKYYESMKDKYLFLLFVSIPLSFFSGHFQTSIYVLIFIILFALFKFFESKNKKSLINSLIFIFLGLTFSSLQIIPSIELYNNAPRSLIFQKINAVSFSHLSTILAPDFYGNPVTRNNFLGHYIEWNMFTGVVGFLLSLYTFTIRSKKAFFFISMALASLILCLNTPILDIFVNLKIPVLSTSSLSRILIIFSFSISVLAAFGIDEIKNDLETKNLKKLFVWIFLSSIIIFFLWIYILAKLINPEFALTAQRNLILPTVLSIGLIISVIFGMAKKKFINLTLLAILVLVSFDMLRFATKWQPFESKNLTYVETPIIKEIKTLDKNYRIFTPFGEEGSTYFNFQSAEGYDPLYIKRYGEFAKSLSDGNLQEADRLGVYLPDQGKYFTKTIDFLGIKYVLQKKSDIGKSWAFQFNDYPKNKFNLIYDDKKFQIYENSTVLPKTYLVGEYVLENENQKILNKIYDKNFDFKKSVVLEKNPNIEMGEGLIGTTKIISYSPNKIVIDSTSNKNAILVISDNFYPGWKTKVNGKDSEILRANYTFRAVPIPKGENNIEIYFDPDSFKLGITISALSFLSAILIMIGRWYNLNKWTKRKFKTAKYVIKSSAKTADGKQIKKRH